MTPAILVPAVLIPWHLGSLHPYEQGLVVLLAFGPFAVLGIVVWLRRREENGSQPLAPAVAEGGSEAPEAASHTALGV